MTLERKLMEKALKTYIAVLLDLTPQEIVQSFSRAANDSKFMRVRALLRDFASVAPSGDPIANEARAGLFRIVKAIRGGHWLLYMDIDYLDGGGWAPARPAEPLTVLGSTVISSSNC
jgi:hypothetical protein